MKVRIKRLSENAIMPKKAHTTDAGFDVFRGHTSTGLSFVSKEDAKEFAETFGELLNIAKPLL